MPGQSQQSMPDPQVLVLMGRIAELDAKIQRLEDLMAVDPYPPIGAQDEGGRWPGKVYVLGITYSGLTNGAMPYVRVTLGAGGTVLVEETDEAFPSEMPPNEEWYIKSEETVPPRITRFG